MFSELEINKLELAVTYMYFGHSIVENGFSSKAAFRDARICRT